MKKYFDWLRLTAKSLLLPVLRIQYKHAWNRREEVFIKFMKRWGPIEDREQSNEVVWIYVQAWYTSPLPWYMLTLARALYQRGHKIKVIFDDNRWGEHEPIQLHIQNSIAKVLKCLPRDIDTVRLSEIEAAIELTISDEKLDFFSEAHTTHIMRGEARPVSSVRIKSEISGNLRKIAARIQTLFDLDKPSYAICGGGLYSSSSLFMHYGQENNIEVSSVDCGNGRLLLSVNGIAAQFRDIPDAFSNLHADDTWVVNAARDEVTRRVKATDQSSFESDTSAYQLTPATGGNASVGVLLLLNISYDTAAQSKHIVFSSQTEWLLETVAWVLNNTKEKIVVRQHPAENIKPYRSSDNYQDLLKKRFQTNPRLKFISASASVNTYDLLTHAKVVIVNTSTVGMEAAAFGKTVITENNSYYSDLGFVWKAGSYENYFNLIEQALNGSLVVSKEQCDLAWRCYYLVHCCSILYTVFTPQEMDYDKWALMDPVDIFRMPEVIDIMSVLEQRSPLATTRHIRRRLERNSNAIG